MNLCHTASSLTIRLMWTAISLVSLASVAIAAWQIGHPSFYYDELLFVNAALGGHTDDFIRMRIGDVPFLLMDYIGALKAWIYAPIFSVFPINPWTVRLPAILFAIAGNVLTIRAMWLFFGQTAALITLLLIAFDPTILTQSRLDWGPDALMFFFRGTMLFSIAKWSLTRARRWAWAISICLLLGLYDKLNFIWLAGAFLGSLAFVERKAFIKNSLADSWQGTAWLFSVVIILLAAWRGIFLSSHMPPPSTGSWLGRLSEAWRLFTITWQGGGALEVAVGNGRRFALGFMIPQLVCMAAAILSLGIFWRRHPTWIRPWIFLLFLFFLTALGFIVTRSATGPHHSAVLSGLWQLPCVPLLAALLTVQSIKTRIAAAITISVASFSMLVVSILTIQALVEDTPSPNWDPAIWQLGQYVAGHPNYRYITTDWGMGNQIIAATKNHANYSDAWPSFTDLKSALIFVKDESRKGPCYYIAHYDRFTAIKNTNENLNEALKKTGVHVTNALTLKNTNGENFIKVLLATQ